MTATWEGFEDKGGLDPEVWTLWEVAREPTPGAKSTGMVGFYHSLHVRNPPANEASKARTIDRFARSLQGLHLAAFEANVPRTSDSALEVNGEGPVFRK